jgi:hypothetical protein
VHRSQLRFETGRGGLAVEGFDLASLERTRSADSLVGPRLRDSLAIISEDRIEQALGYKAAFCLGQSEGVLEDLFGGGGHVEQSTWPRSPLPMGPQDVSPARHSARRTKVNKRLLRALPALGDRQIHGELAASLQMRIPRIVITKIAAS